MNILFWADGFSPRIGGIETQGLCLTTEMQKRNHNCFVLANRDNTHFAEEECIEGVHISRFDFSAFRRKEINGQDFLKIFEKKLMDIFEKHPPDVIHLYSFLQSNSALLYLLFVRKLPCPVVLTLHSIYPESSFKFLERFLNTVSHIGCVSTPVIESIKLYAPEVLDKTQLIPNALLEPKVSPTPASFSPPVLLCLGRLSNEKGFDIALKAFAKVLTHFPEARLLLVGSGPEQASLQKWVTDLQIEKSVDFIGGVNITDVPQIINQASIVLVPSLMESFGLVALEAAQMERAVIASATGGLLEVIEHEKTGLLVPPNDVEVLYENILRLLENSSFAIEMGKNARPRALEKFSAKIMVDSYEKIYTQFQK